MTRIAIPEAALAQHIAILGKTGSGKTYTAKGAVEQLLKHKKRVCIVDPTGAWYGLRSSSDGKQAGFPVIVIGGDHADLPIGRDHGQAIAEAVATSATPFIIDTSLMRVSERTQFFTDFAEALLRLNRDPLHVVIDEAHNFMPQGKVPDPQAGKMLHAGNNLVSMGRSRGLRIMLITQRPAKLHKDALTQVETLISLRLVAPQDRRAVEDWIGEWAEPKQGAELLQSLPSLPTGTGWLWAPELGILKQCTFPKISTYDSSAAPAGARGKIVLADIDLPTIQAKLETVAKEAAENDPKRLRARIAELEKAKGKPDAEAIRKADEAAYARGRLEGAETAARAVTKVCAQRLHDLASQLGKPLDESDLRIQVAFASSFDDKAKLKKAHADPTATALRAVEKLATSQPAEGITNPLQRILDAMAKLEALGVKHMSKGQTAAFAEASPKSSAFQNNVSRLRTMGLIDYPRPGDVSLTDAGRRAASYPSIPPTLADLQAAWLRLLSRPQARILECAIEAYPDPLTKAELADKAGASPLSSAFQNNVSSLRSLGVLDYPQQGHVVATDLLFPVAA